ncbi:DeoR/GlpR family DNA-binding transcription regulator [Pelagovum pacificum]|uniref:DeoR/GlpR transcriptional regulator n=1 Tax=Pelagovum pacificum TaxID=2588711 RepID=A0A5C5GF74_9RHOB|nr:DeoR/GlpR family DNA-binding transcription regulator [Pelagovum pacificum]QQA44279.1 DeoR/GlpR transcriptional regulator [Pelagovum pacificum]TNY32599.1 DeoR/GlpR transcriptional regulator [Pelagovum pacificum]
MSNDRIKAIRDYLFRNGTARVQDLAAAFNVSMPTIRRDLTEMEAAGTIAREHGFARIAQTALQEVAFGQREGSQIDAKRAIAAECLRDLTPGSSVFLDAGTTVLQLARALRLSPRPLIVFTNGIVVASELSQVAGVELNLLGGRVRAENMSMVGALAESMIAGLWFDHVVLGASAVSDDGWITSYDADEAQLNARMAERSGQVTVLADSSKFGCRQTYSVMKLNGKQRLLTDDGLSASQRERLSAQGCRVTAVPLGVQV